MIDFLLQLSAPLSLLLITLLAAQRWLLTFLGPRNMYALWGSVPVLVLGNLLTPLLPVAVIAEPIKRYQVSVQQFTAAAESVSGLFWLWVAGVVVFVTFLLFSYISHCVVFNRAAPVKLTAINIPCRQANSSAGPYITGLVKPNIVLPQDFFTRYNTLQQRLIVEHELCHWHRGDLHLNYFALILLSLFWFNPLAWLAYQHYRRAQELACDAVVTAQISNKERIAYGYALLSSTQQSSFYRWPLHHHYGEFNTMKQRILQLQRQQGFSKTIVTGALAVVVGATLLVQQPVLAGGNASQQLAPVMRVEPRYPIKAAEQGITGYVQLNYDVTADGKVVNVRLIKSSPSGVFDNEAVQALKKWQYNATGKSHTDNKVQLDFELEAEQGMERIDVTPQHKKSGS